MTDYGTNFAFVRHVLMMDTTFPDADIRYRALTSPWVHHLAYGIVILIEIVASLLCWIGTLQMARALPASAAEFARGKSFAVLGLTLAYLLWQVGLFGDRQRVVRHVDVQAVERNRQHLSVRGDDVGGTYLREFTRLTRSSRTVAKPRIIWPARTCQRRSRSEY